MKISTVLAIFLSNGTAVFAANSDYSRHAGFENSLMKSIKNNRSPFNPINRILNEHKEKPRISIILKFQMDKILNDYEQHLSQGPLLNKSRIQKGFMMTGFNRRGNTLTVANKRYKMISRSRRLTYLVQFVLNISWPRKYLSLTSDLLNSIWPSV